MTVVIRPHVNTVRNSSCERANFRCGAGLLSEQPGAPRPFATARVSLKARVMVAIILAAQLGYAAAGA